MSWINSIANGIEKAFNKTRPALKAVPPLFLICEATKRPGLSAIALTSAIIKRLPEAGVDIGVNVDGSPNIVLGTLRVAIEELVDHIHNNLQVNVGFGPDMITSIGYVETETGPKLVVSKNINAENLYGIGR